MMYDVLFNGMWIFGQMYRYRSTVENAILVHL